MRILILSQWFDPEPFFKGLPFAKALVEKGHDVQVLTGFPNYPGGKLYPGYKVKLFQREKMDGIPVVRVALYPSHDRSSIRRIFNYVSFAISAALLGPILIKKVDVIYVYHPPATVGLPAIILKLLKRAPIILDIQDLWPDSVMVSGMLNSKIALGVLWLWCSFFYRMADKIVVQSPGFKETLKRRGVNTKKLEVIYNWCDEKALLSGAELMDGQDKKLLEGKFNIIYAGNIGKAHGLEAVIKAAEILNKEYPNIQFVFVGDGVELDGLKRMVRENGIENVLFLGRKPIDKIGGILNVADVLLVHLKESPLFRITIPSKLQAYMAIGKPILVGVRGDAERLVIESGAGRCCTPGNPSSIAEAALGLYLMNKDDLKRMGKRGKEYYLKNMNVDVGVEKFESLFCGAITNIDAH